MSKANDPFLVDQVKKAQHPNYLGDFNVVKRLLSRYASSVLTSDLEGDKLTAHADQGARALAKVLLGQDPNYPGPRWNGPGQIDMHAAERAGIESDDPEERVAGALIQMVSELWDLGHDAEEQQAIQEQWDWAAREIVERYTKTLMGLPLVDFGDSGPHPMYEDDTGPEQPQVKPSPLRRG